MLAATTSFCLDGVIARQVQVEVDVHGGLPSFRVVGLPDAAVREARDRVHSGLLNSELEFPQSRITVNLAPADLRKAGPGFDLAIAAALLMASEQLKPTRWHRLAVAGELGLEGTVRKVPGVLAMAEAAARAGFDAFAVPAANAAEAALAADLRVLPIAMLADLGDFLAGIREPPAVEPLSLEASPWSDGDLADLRGQPNLRRALELCAAGGHSLLMVGPAGAGKTLAAQRLPSILPPLSREEALEVARVASACGRLDPAKTATRPYRSPHHTISAPGLIGGGSPPRAGEITLAHQGVLFLDELPEFSRSALESLRTPMERGRVLVTRARGSVELPCRFLLVAAANPCPCGHGDDSDRCSCPPWRVRQYVSRLSGALTDRIDMVLAVSQPDAEAMGSPGGEPSAVVRERVLAARERQHRRLGPGRCNGEAPIEELRASCLLEAEAAARLAQAHERLGLSGRGHDRVLRLARTVADLAGRERIAAADVGEALRLRRREEPG